MKHVYFLEDPQMIDVDLDFAVDQSYYSRKWLEESERDHDDGDLFSFHEQIIIPLYEVFETVCNYFFVVKDGKTE
uniref:Uncharacterized protein n=1 Tax=viral metagenome TaxID=1070528 RepID=A0A6C0B1Y1_9ZZZZ